MKSPSEVLPLKDHFRIWLLSKNPRGVVGVSRSASDCPIARFAREYYDKICFVSSDGILSDGDMKSTWPWIHDFTETVDCYGGLITAERALEILDKPALEILDNCDEDNDKCDEANILNRVSHRCYQIGSAGSRRGICRARRARAAHRRRCPR
jgi:hypothetical protein